MNRIILKETHKELEPKNVRQMFAKMQFYFHKTLIISYLFYL